MESQTEGGQNTKSSGVAPSKIRLLLVDDEPMIARGLIRGMQSKGPKFDILTCTSTDEGLAILEKALVDVVVTDLSMPQKDGSALLAEVQAKYPTMLRFVLSGEAQQEVMIKASRLAHQYFSKPCDTIVLRDTILAMIAQLNSIKNPEVSRTLSMLEGVPSRQATLAELLRMLSDNRTPVDDIAAGLRKDPALTARLLKVANSPYFGRSGTIESLDDAVGVLGLDAILSMAASHKLFALTPPSAQSKLNIEPLWEHCVHVSHLVRKIGYALKVPPPIIREAVTAALLHDIGKLVLAYAVPLGFAASLTRAEADKMPSWQAEHFVFGNHHADVGACLLKLWGLPRAVVEAVADHHVPHRSAETALGAATLVHIADALAHAISRSSTTAFLDREHLKSLNVESDLSVWESRVAE